ncbi:MAG: hypothetical protein M3Y43_09720 [Pseudomonadota bacterium]|nr:hypothetical protein [Pseudomonadota bacterium]MDQ2705433.1 hypothetical protein [Pseudomonadota bacterium]
MTEGKTTILDELLDDPMVQMVMARDSVHPDELRRALERHRTDAIKRGLVPPAHVIAACQANSLCA